jgi:hypothetical protein
MVTGQKQFHLFRAVVASRVNQVSTALELLGLAQLLNSLRYQDITDWAFVAKGAGKARGDAELIRRFQQNVCDAARIFHPHPGGDEIDEGAADLRLVQHYIAHIHFAKIAQFSPGGEFGFDGKGDEHAHKSMI